MSNVASCAKVSIVVPRASSTHSLVPSVLQYTAAGRCSQYSQIKGFAPLRCSSKTTFQGVQLVFCTSGKQMSPPAGRMEGIDLLGAERKGYQEHPAAKSLFFTWVEIQLKRRTSSLPRGAIDLLPICHRIRRVRTSGFCCQRRCLVAHQASAASSCMFFLL